MFVVPASGAPVPLDEASPLEVHAGDAITLQAQFTAGSAEAYQSAVAGQSATVTEILRVSWFATGGSLSEPVTGQAKPNTIWRANTHIPPSGEIDLYAVGRDERGGTDYLHRRLILR